MAARTYVLILLLACLLAESLCLFFPKLADDRPDSRDVISRQRKSKTIRNLLEALKGKKRSAAKAKVDVEERSNERVSFRECNLTPGQRLDCGYYGVTADACYSRGCCYGETNEPDVPWCYHSIPTITSQCMVHNEERQECGWYGIRKEQCLDKGCCWQPSNADGVAWCYHQARMPVFEGECGVPAIAPNAMSRIVGGIEATEHSWPWMASLQVDNSHFCGGSLINNQWVVSAAHCEPAFFWGSRRTVVLGLHDQRESSEATVVDIDLIIPHEDYGSLSGMDHDIMLLKLVEPVEFNDHVSPVCLPGPGEDFSAGKRCYTTGWGTLQSGGSAPDLLQQVMVPILDTDLCNKDEWYDGALDATMVCAGYEEGGRDSCQGDSGGPLVCYDDSWKLTGIVSWGEGCAFERKPGIYARTSALMQWVESTVAANSD